MGEVVNLNRVRKDRAKAERTKTAKERAAAERLLDGSKLED